MGGAAKASHSPSGGRLQYNPQAFSSSAELEKPFFCTITSTFRAEGEHRWSNPPPVVGCSSYVRVMVHSLAGPFVEL